MVKPDSMDDVFQALSSAARRRMLDIIQSMPGCSVNDVLKYFNRISRIAVLKHLNVLESANLITSKKVGRVRELYFNAVPIQLIYDRWTTAYSQLWATHATRIKYHSEQLAEALNRSPASGAADPRSSKSSSKKGRRKK